MAIDDVVNEVAISAAAPVLLVAHVGSLVLTVGYMTQLPSVDMYQLDRSGAQQAVLDHRPGSSPRGAGLIGSRSA